MKETIQPLSILKVRPIGLLPITDDGEEDENVICVHADDPQYGVYEHFGGLVEHRFREWAGSSLGTRAWGEKRLGRSPAPTRP